MTKTDAYLKKVNKLLEFSGPLAFLSFIGGFVLWGIRIASPLSPIALPVIIFLFIYILMFVLNLVITIFEPSKENENKGLQFLMTSIVLVCSVIFYLVVSKFWNNEYFLNATKNGYTDFSGQFSDLFNCAINDWKSLIVVVLVGLLLTVLLTVSLLFVKEKHIKRYSHFLVKTEFIMLVSVLCIFLINIMYYTSFGAKLFCFVFGMFLILLIPTIKVIKNTCPKCYRYNCGKTLIETIHETVVDHDTLKTTSTRDVKIDGEVVCTIKYVTPTIRDLTIHVFRCNNCKKADSKLFLNLFDILFL